MLDLKKHLLVITPWFPCLKQPYRGVFIEDWVEAMAGYFNMSIDVIHICPLFEPKSGFILRPVIEEKPFCQVHHLYIESKYPKFIKNWPNLISNKVRPYVERHIIKRNPDLIHQHSLFLSGELAYLLHKKYRIPYIITEHWSHIKSHLIYNPWRFLLLRTLKHSNGLTAVSSSLAHILQRRLPSKKIFVTPNFVQDDFSYKKETSPRLALPIKLLWVGDLKHRGKKISLVLKALNRPFFC